jgi:Ca-activated chloride channel family protein
VLTGLRLEPAGLRFEPASVVPARLPDLFAGAPLCILGRYRGAAGALALQARASAGQAWAETMSASVSDNRAIPCVWARGHIRDLEDRFITAQGDRTQLEKQIVETSLRFGVLCRFTAFVAVDRSEVVNKGGQVHKITQPVEAPEGWAMLESGVVMAQTLSACADAMRGASATGFAMRADAEYEALGPPPPGAPMPKSEALPTTPLRARRQRGLLNRLFGGTAPQAPLPAPSPPADVDLSAYRRRAQELLEELEKQIAADVPSRLVVLGSLAVKLEALVEDLKSVGVAAAEVRPLDDVLQDLKTLFGDRRPGDAAIAAAWSRTEAVLRSFAGSTAGRREGFWK